MWTLRRTSAVRTGAAARAAHSAPGRAGRRVALPLLRSTTLLVRAAQAWNAPGHGAAGQNVLARCMSSSAAGGGAANDGDGSGAADDDAASHTNDAAAAAVDADADVAADGSASSATSMSAMPPAPGGAGAAPAVRWSSLPPHHRSLEQYESALRTLRRLQAEALAAGMRYAAANATAAPVDAADASDVAPGDTAPVDSEASGDIAPAADSSGSGGSVAAAPPREFSSEELSHATLEFQKGNRAPLAALMARKAPLSAAQVAAASLAASKPALPPSYRLGSVPVLPWVRPLLPGTKTTLRIPIKDIAPFLEHVTAQARSAAKTQEMPRYLALFHRLARDEPPPPLEPALRDAVLVDAFEALKNLEAADRKAGLRIDGTPLEGPNDPLAWPEKEQRTPSHAAALAAVTPPSQHPAAASPPGFSVAIEDGDGQTQKQPPPQAQPQGEKAGLVAKVSSFFSSFRSQLQAPNTQAAPSLSHRARPFPLPSHPLRYKRAALAPPQEPEQPPANALATSSAAAGAFSLRQLLYQVHPMGTLVELVSLPASDWKRRQVAPLSLAALEAALAEESAGGFLSVRVVALHRAGLLAAGPHPAGFMQADVQVYTDSSDDTDGAAAAGAAGEAAAGADAAGADAVAVAPAVDAEEEARLRRSSLDSACAALHEQVRLLLALHQRAAEAPHVPRRAQALWAYDAAQAAAVADHAASLTLASGADLQALLGERSVLARVRMAAALVAHDYGVLLRQNALGAARAADPRWTSIRKEALQQEKELVQAALLKLREAPQTPLPPGAAAPGAKQTPAAAASAEPASSAAAGEAGAAPGPAEKSDAPAAEEPASSKDESQAGPRTPQAKAAPQPAGPPQSSIQLFAAKVRGRLLTRKLPAEALAAFEEELGRLESMESDSSAAAHAIKHYVDWLSILPWGVCSDETLDLARAERVLDAEHYGLHDVKNQILELVAMGLLKNRLQAVRAEEQDKEGATDAASASAGLEQTHGGKILCLVGPPGVGKTSIGRSIANALDRKFFRLSVGGLGDVSEIKGHRRTYTGALPGQLVRALKTTGVSNPVVLVDEVDKLGYRGGNRAGGGVGGDPASALLEVLDPEQNGAFVDHYLDVPVDLSRVLFVCTANDVERIPGPLRDRMEVVHVSGYTALEKHQIAQRYLLPALYRATGVRPDDLAVDESAVEALIRWYCREPGVRSLNKHLDKLFRKAAYKIARKQITRTGEETAAAAAAPAPAPAADAVPAVPASSSSSSSSSSVAPLIRISASNLSDYVGQRKYARDRLYPSATPIGVAMGLAYSEHGGATIFIESGVAESHADNPAAAAAAGLLGPVHQPERPARQRDELHDEDEEGEDEADAESGPPAGGAPAPRHGGGRGGFFCTGQLGSVMKESSSIAYTVAKRLLSQLQPRSLAWFQSSLLHVHLPTGAQPKDGPSAGVALTMALLSLALHRPLAPDLAMTGELTLTGQVTGVGGIKEKLLAAKRAQVRAVILPDQNRAAVHEVQTASPELLDGVRIHFVAHVRDVLPIAFPGLALGAESEAPPQQQLGQPHAAPSLLDDLPAAPGATTASL